MDTRDNFTDNSTGEILSLFDLSPELLKNAIEVIIKEKPKFKKVSLTRLSTNNEFCQMLKKYIEEISSPSKSEAIRKIKSVIPGVGDKIALITDKNFKYALSTRKNPYAYIQQLEEDFFQQLEFDPENGTMNIKGNFLETVTLQNIKTKSNLKELDLPLLRSLYTIIYSYADKIDTDTVTIYLPTLTKHLGINIRGDNTNASAFFSKIKAFDNVIGVLENGSFYRLLTFLKYDKDANAITFGSPYMNKILRTLQEVNTIVLKKGISYIKPHHSFLIRGPIANERNKSAVEIVNSFITLLHQRGIAKQEKPMLITDEVKKTVKQAIREELSMADGISDDHAGHIHEVRTTMHKKISEIIDEIPILAESLERLTVDRRTNMPKIKTAREKNIILQRAFRGAYTLLKTKTDVYKYYNNLKITEIIPTVSTLEQVIEISHTGINKNYKKV